MTPTIAKLIDIISELPEGYTVQTTSVSHVAACTELVRAVDIAACGETTTTEAELEGDITMSDVRRDESSVVIFHDDRLVALLTCFNSLPEGRDLFFDFFIHPEVDAHDAKSISMSAVKAAEEFTRIHAIENNLATTKCKTALYKQDFSFVDALEKRDFEFHRTFWRMKRMVTQEQQVVLPPGYEIADFENSDEAWRELHQVQTSAFMDYYDFQPLSFDAWQAMLTGGVNDPSLWRVVKHQGHVVGYLMGSHRFTDEGFGYVASLGVLREHRAHGIAKALLADAFNRDARFKMQGTLLHGDSSNPTGAMKLYESVGMHTDRVYVAYRKEITTRLG
jgi:mycothiol synthase